MLQEEPADERLEGALECVEVKLLEKLLEWLDVWAAGDDVKGVACAVLVDDLLEEDSEVRLRLHPQLWRLLA